MHGHEKSDPAVVAVKPANKDGQPPAELVEPGRKRLLRLPCRADRQSGTCHLPPPRLCRQTPEVGAVCGKAARTVLCGGAQ
jgi:hypothetical protein